MRPLGRSRYHGTAEIQAFFHPVLSGAQIDRASLAIRVPGAVAPDGREQPLEACAVIPSPALAFLTEADPGATYELAYLRGSCEGWREDFENFVRVALQLGEAPYLPIAAQFLESVPVRHTGRSNELVFPECSDLFRAID